MRKLFLREQLFFIFFCFYSLLIMAQEITLDKLNSSMEYINSFQAQYIELEIQRFELMRRRGSIFFKKNLGYLANYQDRKGVKIKKIVNFPERFDLTINELTHEIYKVDYNKIPEFDISDCRFLTFSPYDILMPFNEGILEADSIQLEKEEKIEDKEYRIISAIMSKYPFLGNKCKIWLGKDDNFVHKFVIYNEKEEPIFSLEVTEVEINPEIDDKEFSLEIPSGFKEIDITEEFAQQYRILTELYNLYAQNEELRTENEELRISNKELKERIEELKAKVEELEKKTEEEKITGKAWSVLLVDRELKFLIIGIGKNEGIALGDVFEVFQKNDFLGRIQVTKVYADLSVAEPITEGLMEIIREGDRIEKLHEK